jgi:CheY-specific phosphatase CheX
VISFAVIIENFVCEWTSMKRHDIENQAQSMVNEMLNMTALNVVGLLR